MVSNGDKLQEFLQNRNWTQYIRLQWIDFSGILRTRFVPRDRCLEIAKGNEEYLLPQVSMIIPVSKSPIPIASDLEIWCLRPDWSSIRCCGFKENHASVMCFLAHKEAEETYNKCPRMLLSRGLQRLQTEWDTKVLAGFEIEVMLLDQDCQPLNDIDRLNSYQTTAGLRGKKLDIVEEILDSFKVSSINVHHFHTETHDQIEFALSPEPLLDAVDSLILAQETIRTIFVRHNIKATMTPKPSLKGQQMEFTFTCVLTHMNPLCAFGMANFDSYVRTTTGAAGKWAGYGTENRDLPVRKITEQHWEFRMTDGTSNPYLFAGAVLLAGICGLSQKLTLAWEDCHVFPHSLDEGGRAKYGLDKRMPSSLREALDSLKTDNSIKSWIPKDMLNSYIAVKEKDAEAFQKMTDDQRRLRFLEFF
ncbi:hypothetical protein VF21_10324 [Pseudogymnoascus sp. 05NY08]|nr:hypothetical protein VF21_10324 [Pseudogymnoascus sp. 05NY08]